MWSCHYNWTTAQNESGQQQSAIRVSEVPLYCILYTRTWTAIDSVVVCK